MNNFLVRSLTVIALSFCLHAQASPILSLEIASDAGSPQLEVNLAVRGAVLPEQSIGAFDIILQFDPGYLHLLSVSMSGALGSPADRIDSVTVSPTGTAPATLRLFAVSLLELSPAACGVCSGPYLVDRQSDDFLLATMRFAWSGPRVGSTVLSVLDIALSTGAGAYMPVAPIAPLAITVPEPGSAAVLMLGLLALWRCRLPARRASAAARPASHQRSILLACTMLACTTVSHAQVRDLDPYVLVITKEPPLIHWFFDYPEYVALPIESTQDLRLTETVIADFDGDPAHTWDFLAATRDERPALYLFRRNNVPFGFTPVFVGWLEPDPKADYYIARGQPQLAPDYGLGLIAADLDNDGDIDFLEAVNRQFGEGLFWIARGNAWLNDGRGQFTKKANAFDFSSIFTGWTLGMSSTLADLNGDGYPDMLVSEQPSGGDVPSRVYSLFGKGDGTFGAPVYAFTAPHPATFISMGDVNNNGTVDALVGMDDDGDPGQVYAFYGLGNGTFHQQAYQAFDTNPAVETGNEQAGAGKFQLTDLTRDGVLDVVLSAAVSPPTPGTQPSARLWLYRGVGDGRFEPAIDLGTTFVNTAFSAPFLEAVPVHMRGDLVGDGHINQRDVAYLTARVQRDGPTRPAMGPDDPFDLNHDGLVNVADVRTLVLMCTLPRCALPAPPDVAQESAVPGVKPAIAR